MLCRPILASWKYISISENMLVDKQHERMVQRKAKLGLNIFEKVIDQSALLAGWQTVHSHFIIIAI